MPNDYVSYHGNLIAHGWPELTSGTLQNPVIFDEYGHLQEGSKVWTGSNEKGELTGTNCLDWASKDKKVLGTYGLSGAVDLTWTDAGDFACSGAGTAKVPILNRLYCVEQE